MGIECDGATYHSAQSSRDRDRLRQQVLEGLGWNIHRIWSTAWFKDSPTELKKVVKSVEKAKALGSSPPVQPPKVDPKPDVIPSPLEPQENPLTEKYQLAKLEITDWRDLPEVPSYKMVGWIKRVVDIESPVHSDEVAKRVTRAAGVNRIGNRIQRSLETAARQAARSGAIRIKGEFFYSALQSKIVVRDRTELPTVSRKLDLVAPEEIEATIKIVVLKSLGIERGDLPREVCRLLGLGTVRGDRQQTVEMIADKMADRGELTRRGDSLVVTNSDD